MTRTDVPRDVLRRGKTVLRLGTCLALLALATACGPLGDDDEEEPTATGAATPAAAAASPAARPAPATPGARSSPVASDEGSPAARATPTPAAADDEETPEAAAETRAADDEPTEEAAEAPEPPVVEDCAEPAELPDAVGPTDRVTSEEADEGVNLRAGPGPECDLLTTLDPGTPVEVISGPVSAGELLWVKVEVAGDEGWVAQDFLDSGPEENAEEEGA